MLLLDDDDDESWIEIGQFGCGIYRALFLSQCIWIKEMSKSTTSNNYSQLKQHVTWVTTITL